MAKVEEAARSFLDFVLTLYPHLRPAYGWIDEVGTNAPKSAQAASLKLTHICWANIFGPPYVEKYGLDFLLGAPGWRVEQLPDGGVLYVLSPSFVDRWQVVGEHEVESYFRQRVPGVRIYHAEADQFRE